MATEVPENEVKEGSAQESDASAQASPASAEANADAADAASGGTDASVVDASAASETARRAWAEVEARYATTLSKQMKPAGAGQYKSKGKLFIDWCIGEGLVPSSPTHWDEVLKHYSIHVDSLGAAKIVAGISKKSAAGLIEEVKNMAKGTRNEEVEEQLEEELDEEGGEGEGEEEEEEERPARRARRAPAPEPRVVYVTAPAPRGRPPGAKDSYQRAGKGLFGQQKSVLPRSQMIRVYKRKLGGTRAFIGDYDVNDIGGAIQPFIREVIDPDHGEGEVTTYLVYELDANGNDKGQPVRVDIEAPPDQQQQAMNDPFSTAKRAMEFFSEFREMQAAQQPPQSEVLQEAKKRAAASSDMNSLMMLMMMERMMGGSKSDESVLLKLFEQLKPQPQLANLPPMPPMPPMMAMPPPPPPANDGTKELLLKLIEKSMDAPKKDEGNFLQQFMMMKQLGLLGPDAAPSSIDQKLAALEQRISAAAAAGMPGLDGYVNMFTKMREMVTTLAPQMNAGGLLGTVQNFLTPELVKVGGNFVAQVLSQTQQKLQQQTQPPQPPTAPQLPAQTPAKTNPMVENAANALRAAGAAPEPTLVNQSVELLMACYEDDRFKEQINFAAQQLLMGNSAPANMFLTQLMQQIRPDLANNNFISKVISEVMVRFNASNAQPAVAAPPAPPPLPSNVQVGGAAAEPAVATQLAPAQPENHVPNENGYVNGTPQNVNVPTAGITEPNAGAAVA